MAASGFNITSAIFDGQTMLKPISGQIELRGVVVNESAGTQVFISDHKLTQIKAFATVAFNDIDDLALMQNKIGDEGTLVVVVPKATTGTKTGTVSNAMVVAIVGGGAHAEFGTHISIMEARSSDGIVNPVVWT